MIAIEEMIDIHQQLHHLVVAVAAVTPEMTTESAHTSAMPVMEVVMLAGTRGHAQITTAAGREATEVAVAAMVAPAVEGVAMTPGSKEAAGEVDTRLQTNQWCEYTFPLPRMFRVPTIVN